MDTKELIEFELALNRLGARVVQSAIDKLSTHPQRKRYEILGFTAGSAQPGDHGIKIRSVEDGNYSLRISGPVLTSLFGPYDEVRHTFTEMGIRGSTIGAFVEVLTDILRRQGRQL